MSQIWSADSADVLQIQTLRGALFLQFPPEQMNLTALSRQVLAPEITLSICDMSD